mmetsp:Transcript_27714/g.61851  ORF Transcript_27714/g.61851 Transcript_27714/m.61851 type:complete len:280 (-) Transcript_27714:133-972(-)
MRSLASTAFSFVLATGLFRPAVGLVMSPSRNRLVISSTRSLTQEQSQQARRTSRKKAQIPQMVSTFKRKGDKIYFGARLDVDSRLRNADPKGLAAFLQDPTQIMAASWPRHRIKAMGGSEFRLIQEPIDFAGLVKIDFFVDVETTVSSDGRVVLRSKGIETTLVTGNGRRKVPVELKLWGELQPVAKSLEQPNETGARLKGFVQYETSGPLQGPLFLVPDAVLKISTRAINKAILTFAERDFVNGINRNFREWYTPARRAELEQRAEGGGGTALMEKAA